MLTRKSRLYLWFPTALMLVVLTLSTPANARKYAVDYMELATVLLYDGKFDKARATLEDIDKSDISFDQSRYLSIKGLIELRAGNSEQAATTLDEAILATRVKRFEFDRDVDQELIREEELRLLYEQLAEARYRLQECEATIDALDLAGEQALVRPQLFAVRADCLWRLGWREQAITVLDNGFLKFQDSYILIKQKFIYFVQQGLYTAAADLALELMQQEQLAEDDYLSFAKALEGSGQINKAKSLLHEARLLFPENAEMALYLGHLYLRSDLRHAAAGLFEQAAYLDNKYMSEAAEVYRRAGNIPAALRLNAKITDSASKLTQQIAIFIELEAFERVLALEEELYRSGLVEQDRIRYALAYAHFRVEEFDEAERLLAGIADEELFQKAVAVRQSIANCKDGDVPCQ